MRIQNRLVKFNTHPEPDLALVAAKKKISVIHLESYFISPLDIVEIPGSAFLNITRTVQRIRTEVIRWGQVPLVQMKIKCWASGSGIRCFFDPDPGWGKKIRIRDEKKKSGSAIPNLFDPGSGMEKFGSEINIPDFRNTVKISRQSPFTK